MLQFIFGVFLVLHGLVHCCTWGRVRGGLSCGLAWCGRTVRGLSRNCWGRDTRVHWPGGLLVAAIGFMAGGGGLSCFSLAWWRPVIVAAAIFSSVAYILFWDGKLHKLPDQGAVAILINLAILVAVVVFQWPV